MVEFSTFMGSWPWPWLWIRAWSLPFFISHRVLPVYQISSKSKKLFVDGRTHGRTDVRTEICHLQYEVDFQSLEVDLKSNEKRLTCSSPVGELSPTLTKLGLVIEVLRTLLAPPKHARHWHVVAPLGGADNLGWRAHSKFLHSDKRQQVLVVGGPNTRMAAILKNRKMAISRKRFDRSARMKRMNRLKPIRT